VNQIKNGSKHLW